MMKINALKLYKELGSREQITIQDLETVLSLPAGYLDELQANNQSLTIKIHYGPVSYFEITVDDLIM